MRLHRKFVAGARVCLVAVQKKFNFVVEILHWSIDHIYLMVELQISLSRSVVIILRIITF